MFRGGPLSDLLASQIRKEMKNRVDELVKEVRELKKSIDQLTKAIENGQDRSGPATNMLDASKNVAATTERLIATLEHIASMVSEL